MGNFHPEKINVDQSEVEMLINYIVYITLGIKPIPAKWIYVFVFRTPYIQALKRCQSMVNRRRINSAQSIFFLNITRSQAITPVAKFYHV